MNIFILFGTIIDASELRYTKKSTEYCSITIETIEFKKQKDGNHLEEVTIIPKITIWGHNAKVASESVGNKILLRGKVVCRKGTGQWEGKMFTEFQAEYVRIFGADENVGAEDEGGNVPF